MLFGYQFQVKMTYSYSQVLKCSQIQSQSTCFSKFSWGHAPDPLQHQHAFPVDCTLCIISTLCAYEQLYIFPYIQRVQRFCLTNVKLLPPPLQKPVKTVASACRDLIIIYLAISFSVLDRELCGWQRAKYINNINFVQPMQHQEFINNRVPPLLL